MNNISVIKLMANNDLPKEYREFPINFLYSYFLLCLGILRKKRDRTEFISHKKQFYEMYEFSGRKKFNRTNSVIIFEKQANVCTLKFYLQNIQPPDFEKDFGFDGVSYTYENLLIITFSPENGLRVRTDAKTERKLQLDPFIANTEIPCPFEGTSKFALSFWESYKLMIEKELIEVADK